MRFVIQQHDATTLHYDFRLEVDGVLRSWAVPKGPSTDPREKRLAVEVEDHSLDYADFEGVHESGYGKGAVIVWDAGTYRNLDEERSMAEALDAGHAKFWLEGEKLRGGWTLHRTTAAQAAVAADQAPRRRGRRPPQPRLHAAGVRQVRPGDQGALRRRLSGRAARRAQADRQPGDRGQAPPHALAELGGDRARAGVGDGPADAEQQRAVTCRRCGCTGAQASGWPVSSARRPRTRLSPTNAVASAEPKNRNR